MNFWDKIVLLFVFLQYSIWQILTSLARCWLLVCIILPFLLYVFFFLEIVNEGAGYKGEECFVFVINNVEFDNLCRYIYLSREKLDMDIECLLKESPFNDNWNKIDFSVKET